MTQEIRDPRAHNVSSELLQEVDARTVTNTEPIAIIGMGCRFPNDVNSPESFWQLLLNQVDAITDLPPERTHLHPPIEPVVLPSGQKIIYQGGYLKDIDQFDPYLFGISPREAHYMDPQHRLLMETAWEAMLDAGQVPEKMAENRTGVFIGLWTNEYSEYINDLGMDLDLHSQMGGGRCCAAGRLSYFLNLQGPSLTVDTACSSSLAAVHLACQSLLSGECSMALAGGANLLLKSHTTLSYAKSQMLAPDSRCKFGDARADGFARSEGAGVVVLKPLARALEDNDPVYAIIRATACNNDGKSEFFVMPSVEGQRAMLVEAYRKAGISPGSVDYIEAHGTGTSVGDPVELNAIGSVVAEGRAADRPCIVGSVKANIGHTEAAAGVAGLIKAALCLKHRHIPGNIHFQNPNPNIPWDKLPVTIPREAMAWPEDSAPALAGVNSFGITGTNVHVVLEEYLAARVETADPTASEQRTHLLPISAHTPEALQELAARYVDHVGSEDSTSPSLRDLCYTAGGRRSHHQHRLCITADSREQLRERLSAHLSGESSVPGLFTGRRQVGQRPKVAFIFPGQGSQWAGMGRELFAAEPVFRARVEECASAMLPHLDGWSLLEQFTSEPDEQLLRRIDVVQPLLFAVQVSLAALWRSWGVEPDAVVGHSMGEVAAAHVSGALSLEDAARVICLRSRLMRRLSGRGAMAVVELSAKQAEAAISSAGEGGVEVAASNGPRTTVVSGEAEAVRRLVAGWQAGDVYSREVAVDVASHCRLVDEIEGELREALADVGGRPAPVAMYSTVEAREVSGEELTAGYWARNLRERVRFAEAVRELRAKGFGVFVEVSPHPVLTTAVEETVRSVDAEGAEEAEAVVVGTLRKETGERESITEAVGRLYANGVELEWEVVNGGRGSCVKMPAYPWQRQHYWANADPSALGGLGARGLRPSSAGGHPLLGQRLDAATGGRQHFWEVQLNGGRAGYLSDHRVNGAVVLPGAAYVEMALAGARDVFGGVAVELEGVTFERMLILGEDDSQRVQLVIEAMDEQNALFKFFSREEANGGEAAGESQSSANDWSLLAAGKIRLTAERGDGSGDQSHESLEEIRQRCTREQSASNHYQVLSERALEYGPYFQAVTELWAGTSEVLATLELGHELAQDLHRYRLHPVLLDAAFQTLMSALSDSDDVDEEATYLPVGIRSLRWHGPVGTGLRYRSHLVRRPAAEGADAGQELEADLRLMDEEGQVKVEVTGLRARRVGDGRGEESTVARWFYQLQWQAVPEPGIVLEMAGSGRWLILADGQGVGRQLAERLRGAGAEAVLVSAGDDYRRQSEGEYQVDVKESEHFRRLLREVAAGDERPQPLKVIHLWGLDVRGGAYASAEELMRGQQHACGSLLHLMQALSAEEGQSRVWAVTRGAQEVRAEGEQRETEGAGEPAEVESAQSPLWGLGRAIAHEQPQQWGGLIDLDPRAAAEQWAGQIIDEAAHGAEGGEAAERQVGYRGGQRYVLRLVRAAHLVRADEAQRESGQDGERPALTRAGDRMYTLEITKPGILDNLVLVAGECPPVKPGYVEIKTMAGSLNFKDILLALGTSPDPEAELGEECSGVITAVGEGVEGFKVGDEIVTIVPDGSLKTHLITPAAVAALKPPHLSFEQAAAMPTVFLTAHYSLIYMGRLKPGERVLIHYAAGGVGLAAVQIAQRIGAEVFATAGSEEKREYLRKLGIKHVMNSRTFDFAREIMEITNGAGVDVIVNSTSGAMLMKTLEVLAPYGRFIEIGKRDIYGGTRMDMGFFRNCVTFSSVDLIHMRNNWPEELARLFQEVMSIYGADESMKMAVNVYKAGRVVDAFRDMAQGKHIGKIIVQMQDPDALIAPAPKKQGTPLSDKATYLITGGMGGLGLKVASSLVSKGARHLLLTGRREPSEEARKAIEELKEAGAEVNWQLADVAEADDVAGLFAAPAKLGWPAVRGVVHAAGVLDDGVLAGQSWERFETVMRPKVRGTRNLAAVAEGLDFFIMFSSAAATLGTPGQANYAAANAYMDGLAQWGRARGERWLSINWGAWTEVGLAAREDRARHVTGRGIRGMKPEEALEAFEQLLSRNTVASMVVSPFDINQWSRIYPQDAASPLFAELVQEKKGSGQAQKEPSGGQMRKALMETPSGRQRRTLITTHVREQVAKVLRITPSRLDINTPLKSFGLDSLMALELRNLLESSLEVKLSATAVWTYPTIAALTPHLAEKMGISLASSEEEAPAAAAPAEHEVARQEAVAEVAHLSEKEMADLLSRELSNLN